METLTAAADYTKLAAAIRYANQSARHSSSLAQAPVVVRFEMSCWSVKQTLKLQVLILTPG